MRLIFIFIISVFIGVNAIGQRTDGFYPVEKERIETLKEEKSYAYMQTLDSLLRDKQKVRVIEETKEVKPKKGWLQKFLSSDAAAILGWMLVAVLLIFVVYHFVSSEGIIVNRRKLKIVETEEMEEEVSITTNFVSLIQNAVAKNDYRTAVKYQYLNTLTKLHHKEIIHLESGKTNYDYLFKLPSGLKTEFTPLLHVYEYVWYGEKSPSEEQYKEVASSFEKFNTQF